MNGPAQKGLIVKRWKSGNIPCYWAGYCDGSPKMSACDDWMPLPDAAAPVQTAQQQDQSHKVAGDAERYLAALLELRNWFESERKSISKGNGSQWSMWQCEEQIAIIDAARAAQEKA